VASRKYNYTGWGQAIQSDHGSDRSPVEFLRRQIKQFGFLGNLNEGKMPKGRKPLPPSLKVQRGTARPDRDKMTIELTVPHSLPQQPDWLLTKGGVQVWLDLVARAAQVGATELDSTTLALYCNLLAEWCLAPDFGPHYGVSIRRSAWVERDEEPRREGDRPDFPSCRRESLCQV
jgi:hypothetical protein